MNNISAFIKCSNCGACYNSCPKSAISVVSDMFYKLTVDEDKCIDCGLCQKVCPVNTPQMHQNLKSAYTGYHIESEIVKNSSSGGAFAAIADYVLHELNGVVYAAAYTENCREVVIKSTEQVLLSSLMKSKYVESKVELSFKDLKEKLLAGRTVLFSGAPCQVAGLKRYLGKDYENLYTCDFSCEGMPSHQTYQEYLNGIEKKLKSKIVSVDFRAKLYGWSRHSVRIIGKNGRQYKNFALSDPYFYSFIGKCVNIKEYCLSCDFSNNHYADIILADFWGYAKYSKVKSDDTGLSLVITNSEKGEQLMGNIAPKFVTTVLDLKKASYNMKPRTPDKEFLKKRNNFFEHCRKEGFLKTMEKVKMPAKIKLKYRYIMSKLKEHIR